MVKQNSQKDKNKSHQQHNNQQKLDVQNEINIENSGAGQPHNAKKEALGPNTKR